MLSDKMLKSLAHQLNREMYSGYFYLGMGAYAASTGYSGVSNWFVAQMKEEFAHALKIYEYIGMRGNKVALAPIEEPPQDFVSPLDLFKKTLEHEKKVTAMINDLVKTAHAENDKETEEFLQWFVKEQKEEEETPRRIIERLTAAKSDTEVAAIDRDLGARKH